MFTFKWQQENGKAAGQQNRNTMTMSMGSSGLFYTIKKTQVMKYLPGLYASPRFSSYNCLASFIQIFILK
jgi:hypothetical protein